MMFFMLASCLTMKTGYQVSAIQLQDATVPITGDYAVGPWVDAYGCDYIMEEEEFSVSTLVKQARGRYDGLISVTVEQIDQVKYSVGSKSGEFNSVVSIQGHCFRVRGQVINFVNPPLVMENGSNSPFTESAPTIPTWNDKSCRPPDSCEVVCKPLAWYNHACGDVCIHEGVCSEPVGTACDKSDLCN